ncbi:MAG: aminopeptidase P family protein [Lachnospiraceae bacterium]|nr:aminopeptidase P family protein [Lachnospiraceae bacterium]
MNHSRLERLREEMRARGIDIYVVPSSDFHASEYVGEYFRAREFLTGFTGSAGTAVVTREKAGLWTDGRYFIQAAAQLAGSGFDLYRSGEEGVPKVTDFLKEELPAGGTLGFDGRVVSGDLAEQFRKIAEDRGGSLYVTEDLVDPIWTDRPAIACTPVWILAEEYSGESAVSKLSRIREKMAEENADYHIVASLCDIAWILNLRAGDIAHVPVFLSFLFISEDRATLFVQPDALGDEAAAYLRDCGVEMDSYRNVYGAAAQLQEHAAVLLNRQSVNYRLISALPESVRIIDREDPSEQMKAIKNETELRNTRQAHLKDGVAMTKFMYWLKTNVGKIPMDEYTVGCYLDRLRAGQEHFLDLSFADICAYGPNAAMMHYAADENHRAQIRPEGMLLVDSGGHYLEGTTDITRTFILGPVTPEMKLHFTTVVRCNLALANLRFLYGCGGISMDVVCREPLWELGLDYKCGTGHGVGHILNVHEGPNGFRYKVVPERRDGGLLEAGMITTDEPGVYMEGKYGIRIENELICVEDEKNESGRFMRFEPITYCPIDLDGIEPELMSEKEKNRLNAYHAMVWEKISPYLTEEERTWLEVYTKEIV